MSDPDKNEELIESVHDAAQAFAICAVEFSAQINGEQVVISEHCMSLEVSLGDPHDGKVTLSGEIDLKQFKRT